MRFDVNAFVALVLGGGLAGSLTVLLNSYRSAKDGAQLREKGTVEEIIKQRKSALYERDRAVRERDLMADQRDFWRNRAADLEFILRQAGIEVPPITFGQIFTKEEKEENN